MIQLILGGARSGKSALAEQLATDSGKTVFYLATANAAENDHEMTRRIQRHQQQRPDHWTTIDAPVALADSLQTHAADNHCLLVDCLTLWLSNCLLADNQQCWPEQRQALLTKLPELAGDIILVSNEVGSGVVPIGELNRQFVDESGFLHQSLSPVCERVIAVTAGLPMVLKGPPL